MLSADLGYQSIRLLVIAAPTTNPLTTPQSDPLVPQASIKRPLSPLEIKRIQTEITQLNQQAQVQLEEGKETEAFRLWYRELKLQRAIGKLAEIEALGRIGNIAWSNNLASDLQNISERLVILQQEILETKENNLQLLNSLGNAYQQVRNLDLAIAVYQQLLTQYPNDTNNQQNILETLGKLYLAKFDYRQAADSYNKLLNLLTSNKIELSQSEITTKKQNYLEQLAKIYDFYAQPNQAISIKEQLAEFYLKNQTQLEQLTELKISLAQDYQSLNKLKLASQNYQEAASLALSLQQLALASEALQKLGQLYQNSNQSEQALATYQQLIKIEQQTYNYYGLINIYDRLGQIHWQSHNYPQALTAFQKGLQLAKSLNYQVDYFNNQIKQVQQRINQSKLRN
ncbi:Tetratricopeptide TPR_1 repeat-containing protein [Stanieria cyanosphaera PCC 7437]|uniref:Tetratricopeptide TPR_1 repeat-containing protein n=2 Tax=Stanieria cyanosphaera TaxID=102116 RepID=K9XS57_STAC7|nr:Tetratricopeptide TPR_1 repeat-containing protein [Stanieria cyanosphaera PCC 7437]